MVADEKDLERQRFAKAFALAADNLKGCPKDRGRLAYLARELGVSGEMVRKYLTAEAMPTPARMPYIAAKMHTTTAFLRGEEVTPEPDRQRLQALWDALSPKGKRELLRHGNLLLMEGRSPRPRKRAKDRRTEANLLTA